MIMSDNDENNLTVSELNDSIKSLLLENYPKLLKIHGEISAIKNSGKNVYLTLKDKTSGINVVAWDKKFDNIKNGDDVVISGKINCFQKNGTYQLVASKIDKMGIGLLYAQYEQMKQTFESNGYFTQKRQFPKTINVIAILTASEGAALQDILYVLKKNMYNGKILVKNCFVQGQQCPKSVECGIQYFNDLDDVNIDVLLISRGGGSFEDLIGYSSKEVVKAIYKSKIFTISAIGHEVDNMLSDYAADYRAPTPSIAAEVITTQQKCKIDKLTNFANKLEQTKMTIENAIDKYINDIQCNKKILLSLNPINNIESEMTKLNNFQKTFENKIKLHIDRFDKNITKLKANCELYNSSNIMKKGYSLIIDGKGNIINDSKTFLECVKKNKQIKIAFGDAQIDLQKLLE